jgi:hypothetical protein
VSEAAPVDPDDADADPDELDDDPEDPEEAAESPDPPQADSGAVAATRTAAVAS